MAPIAATASTNVSTLLAREQGCILANQGVQVIDQLIQPGSVTFHFMLMFPGVVAIGPGLSFHWTVTGRPASKQV